MTDSSDIDPATLPEIKNVDDEPDLSASVRSKDMIMRYLRVSYK